MSAEQNHITDKLNQKLLRAAAINNIATCMTNSLDCASSHLEKMISNLFKPEIDSEINKLYDSGNIDNIENDYLSEFKQLRSNARYITQQFVDEVHIYFNDSLSVINEGPKSITFNDATNLLLGSPEEQIREQAILSNLASKAHKDCTGSLSALRKRYLSAYKNGNLRINNLPLGPEQICNSFRNTINIYNPSSELKLILYKLFDIHVIQNLAGVYSDINVIFRDAGILPELLFEKDGINNEKINAFSNSKQPQANKPVDINKTTEKTLALNTVNKNSPESQLPDVFGPLKHLVDMKLHMDSLKRRNSTQTPAASTFIESREKAPINRHELIDLLSMVQQKEKLLLLSSKKRLLDGEIIENFITEETGKGSQILTTKLLQQDRATIELVCMLFSSFNVDKNLPWPMKSHLNRLLIPVVKLALNDKDFFNNEGHAARELINMLVTSSICWNETSVVANDPLYNEANTIISNISSHNCPDAKIFADAVATLKTFLVTNANSKELLVQDTKNARLKAQAIIDEHTKKIEMPSTVKQFLMSDWIKVLTNIYTTEGIQSQAWQVAVKLMKDLISSTQPKITEKEKQDLLNEIPHLIQGIQDSLTQVSCNRNQIKLFFKELESIHMASLKGNIIDIYNLSQEQQADDLPSHDVVEDEFNTDKLIAEIEQATSKFDNATSSKDVSDIYQTTIINLPAGTWLEFTEENHKKVRLKLAWKNKQTQEYSFVDRSGNIVSEITVAELVSDFRDGHIHIIDISPVTDRALNHIRRDLKKTVLKK